MLMGYVVVVYGCVLMEDKVFCDEVQDDGDNNIDFGNFQEGQYFGYVFVKID